MEGDELKQALIPERFGDSTYLIDSLTVAEFGGRLIHELRGKGSHGRPSGSLAVQREPIDRAAIEEAEKRKKMSKMVGDFIDIPEKRNKKKAIELYFMLLCRRTLRFKLLCVVCVRETKLGSIKMGKCGGKSSEVYIWKFGGGPNS